MNDDKIPLKTEVLGWLGFSAIGLVLIVPILAHFIAMPIYHLINPVPKVGANPVVSDFMLLTSMVSMVVLLLSGVLYFLLKKHGY